MRLFKVALVLVAAVLVVVCLPRENKFGYEYEMGRPWKYGQLIASYDFPIYKPDAQLQRERDSVRKLIRPYFTANLVTEGHAIRSLREDYEAGRIKGVPHAYVVHLTEVLHRIYGQGIMSAMQLNQLTDSGITRVHVVVGQESSTQAVQSVFSPRTAYAYVLQTDTIHYKRDIMRRINVNNYLEPNLIMTPPKRWRSVRICWPPCHPPAAWCRRARKSLTVAKSWEHTRTTSLNPCKRRTSAARSLTASSGWC